MPRYHRTHEERVEAAAKLAYETWRDDGPRTDNRLLTLAALYAVGWKANLAEVTERTIDLREQGALADDV